MTTEEKVKAASYALMKGYDYEKMMYCDTMYGKEEFMDDVWDYVIEAKEKGLQRFREFCKENNYKIYPC